MALWHYGRVWLWGSLADWQGNIRSEYYQNLQYLYQGNYCKFWECIEDKFSIPGSPTTTLFIYIFFWIYFIILSPKKYFKLNGVGPIDNKPSTNKLHLFLKKMCDICDTWHVTCDTLHVTRYKWHKTCDLLREVNILSKFQLPSPYGLWFMFFFKRIDAKGWPTQ